MDFDPTTIAKFQFPGKSPCTYRTPIINLTVSHAKNEQTDPLIYICLHNEVKAVHRDFDVIYSDVSVLNKKVAAAAVIVNFSSIEGLLDTSSTFSAELRAQYLALDRVETEDDDEMNFIIFSHSKSALQTIWD